MTPPPPPPEPAAPELEIRVPLPELIEKLSDPASFGVEGPVQVVQTHVSAVFLAADRAYKVKKPIQLWGFLDYGSFDVRRSWCEEEVRLNRRLAPEVYLGVESIVRRPDGSLRVGGEGAVVESAVVMVRLPAGTTFLERMEAGVLDDTDIDEAAALLADFHAKNGLPPATAPGPSAIGSVVRQNFLSTREGVPALFPAVVHEGLASRIAARLGRSRRLLRTRRDAGRMVNGHGDVRLEHVVRHHGEVRIIDCVEFSELVRHVDGLCDLAFLSMDLAERGRWDLAARLERAYLDAAGEDAEEAALLLPLYRSYRAHVRAKVDYQTSLAPEIDAAFRADKELGARRYLALAWTFARADETPPILVMRGPSGVGKSVLATTLAPWLGAVLLNSDVVRKELAGLAPTDRLDAAGLQALHAPDVSAQTYATLLDRARDAVRGGKAAILDATYLRRDSRDEARALARELGAPFAVLDVSCPDDEVRARLARRAVEGTDASDAGIAVYEDQVRTQEPVADDERAHVVEWPSGEPPECCVLEVLARFEAF